MYKPIISAILCLLISGVCLADDFNYDDEARIDVSEDDWDDDPDPTVDIEFGEDPSSVITTTTTGHSMHICLREGNVIVESAIETTVPVYDIKGKVVNMLAVRRGTNVFALQPGINIIMGRKFLL